MRKMLLSMQPYWKEKIMSGEKIYEYRSRFPDEEILAYLYISSPVCGIAGILHLGKKIYLSDWKKTYKDNSLVLKRIEAYEKRNNKVAMPVISYQETELIPRSVLSAELSRFIVPQSYYYLNEEMELTRYIDSKIKCVGKTSYNGFSEELESEVCKNYRSKDDKQIKTKDIPC